MREHKQGGVAKGEGEAGTQLSRETHAGSILDPEIMT